MFLAQTLVWALYLQSWLNDYVNVADILKFPDYEGSHNHDYEGSHNIE